MSVFIVERYLPRIDPAVLEALELVDAGWIRSLVLPGDEISLCMYVAESAEVVADANRRAGLDWERISPAIVVGEL